jgi:serine/threonine-protein kinase
MNQAPSFGPGLLPLSVSRRVDEACDRFEAAWNAGGPPRLEDFMGAPEAPERSALLRELVVLDIFYRRQQRRECRPQDYTNRFPDLDPAWLASVFAPDATVLSVGPQTPPTGCRDGDGDTGPPAEPEPGAVPGAAAGRFRLLKEVGRGGMGVVHKGRDPHLGRELAVKVLREHHQDDPQAVQRFVGEARIAGQLQHPGVVPVYELGNFPDGRPFFTMKLVQGQTLAKLLAGRRRGEPGASAPGASEPGTSAPGARPPVANAPGSPADLPRWLKIFEQVCQTVAYAHSRGVIHRDLKPANVMVGAFGEVQVMDWGLAKFLGADPAGPAEPPRPEVKCVVDTDRPGRTGPDTEPGAVLGTYAYMAPEQARGAVDELDERCDVFGLGAILCEVLTGQPPYVASEAWQIYPKAAAADLADAAARLDGCGADAELVALAKRCLEAEPRDRPGDGGAVAEAVTAYLNGVQERLRRAELERAASQARALEERRRRRVTAALAAAVLLLFVVGGGGWLWITTERTARRAGAEAALAAALDKARQFRGQALEKTEAADDPQRAAAALAAWQRAVAAADQAHDLAAAGLVGQQAARQAELLLVDLRRGLKQAQADARMLKALEDARLARGLWKGRSFDYAGSAAQFAKAFSAYGLDVLHADPPAVSQALRKLPSGMQRALVIALDDWATYGKDKQVERRLGRIAGGVDEDPWRARFRRASDRKALEELARQALPKRLSPVSLELLADQMVRRGAWREAVAVLREAQRLHPGEFWINYDLATALWEVGRGRAANLEEATVYFQIAVALRPDHAPVHYNLATVLKARGNLAGAVAAYRQAIALDPNFAWTHNNLGRALEDQKDVAGAIAEYNAAIRIDPHLATAHFNLGNTLLNGRHDAKGAAAAFRKAIALDPSDAEAHYNLGNALRLQGELRNAVDAYRQAIALRPQYAEAHYNLGNTLMALRDVQGAISALRGALAIRPRFAEAHCNLGVALRLAGDLQGSLAEFGKGHEIGMHQPGWHYHSEQWVKQAAHLAEWDRQLPMFLEGERQPGDARVCMELAAVCGYKRWFAACTRFYQAAFRADPDLEGPNRYVAARLAALAGCGRGKDASGLQPGQQAALRRQALAWLRVELTRWSRQRTSDKPPEREAAQRTMRHWQTDPDLAGVRGEKSLAALPAAERRDWQQFWAAVRRLAAG